jgi:hypothetical protein
MCLYGVYNQTILLFADLYRKFGYKEKAELVPVHDTKLKDEVDVVLFVLKLGTIRWFTFWPF